MRRRGSPIEDSDFAELQRLLGTRASIRSVERLTQPVTFGVWHPVVLLPETLVDSPDSLRRAVVAHELFHVQRRDWLWVMSEEVLRTIMWFHPAVWFATSRIQLAREEVVDELTVLATGNRRSYIEALLAFADAGPVRPAPAFARHAHLFTRILGLSKEKVMSPSRIVLSGGLVVAAVATGAWAASTAFPVVAAAPAAQLPVPHDLTLRVEPAAAAANAYVERAAPPVVARAVAAAPAQGARRGGAPRPGPAAAAAVPAMQTKPITPENPIPRRLSSVPIAYPAELRGSGYRGSVLVRVTLDASGAVAGVDRVSSEAVGDSTVAERSSAITSLFEATTAGVRQWRYQPPADPPIAFFVQVAFDGERDGMSTQSQTAIAAPRLDQSRRVERAQLDGVKERVQALSEQRARLLQQYNEQHPRVVELDKQIADMQREFESRQRLLDMEREFERAKQIQAAGGRAPVRVGGNLRAPQKVKDVRPAYPSIAQSARVQGVVILEVIIDEQGLVSNARILRSIPLLDQAALDAVRQWEFTPTRLNGDLVPVIMTITVQFTLTEGTASQP
jgi:protein TonB